MLDWITNQLPALVTGGVLALIAKEVITWLRDRNTRTRGAGHLAITLAVRFEAYAVECANLIGANDTYDQSGGHAGKRKLKLPPIDVTVDSRSWENLDRTLAERALTFPTVIKEADGYIDFTWEIDGDPAACAVAANGQAGITGMKAWALARDLRQHYKFVAFRDEDIGWDFIKVLREQKELAERMKQAAEQAAAAAA